VVIAEPVETIPPRPDTLKEGGRGASYWQTYWTYAAGWLTKADEPLVVRLCELWDVYDAMFRGAHVQTDGTFYTISRSRGSTGKFVPHPMTSHLRNLSEHIERLEGDLGLNPVERSRIRIDTGQKGSSLDEWQREREARKQAANQ
jgi:P27 family predicted phage terminase small subunit